VELKPSSCAYGREGEAAAAALLEAEGWAIVARNFRAGRGELDLVAARGDTLAIVEVKRWRRNGPSDLGYAIGADKRKRIIETSKIFLANYRQYSRKTIRYDVVLISPGKEPSRYEGAFDETV
jgi:putative endonuclease